MPRDGPRLGLGAGRSQGKRVISIATYSIWSANLQWNAKTATNSYNWLQDGIVGGNRLNYVWGNLFQGHKLSVTFEIQLPRLNNIQSYYELSYCSSRLVLASAHGVSISMLFHPTPFFLVRVLLQAQSFFVEVLTTSSRPLWMHSVVQLHSMFCPFLFTLLNRNTQSTFILVTYTGAYHDTSGQYYNVEMAHCRGKWPTRTWF